jgi:hypothetical protein
MLFLLAAGIVALCAPTWILCAAGMGSLEDEPFFVWGTRLLGLFLVALPLWIMFNPAR